MFQNPLATDNGMTIIAAMETGYGDIQRIVRLAERRRGDQRRRQAGAQIGHQRLL
ncbi:hypothetical protein D3C86_2165990 [compost metagenome]